MASPGDTVVLRVPEGTFLRREFHFGIVMSGGGGAATEVTWDNGSTAELSTDAQLVQVTDASADTLALLGKFVRVESSNATAGRNQGVVVAAYQEVSGSVDRVVVETVLGLLYVVAPSSVQEVENR